MSETVTIASRTEGPVAPAATFCSYLADRFMIKKGFAVGTVPEAEKLVAACDIVLTLHSASTPFTILCLIDREAHPGKGFDLPISELESIAEQCLKYSEQISAYDSRRMPIVIRVIETGPTSAGQLERLKTIRLPLLASKCLASALAVDTVTKSVWSSSLQGEPEWGFVEETLRRPRQSDAEAPPLVAVELPPKTVPYVTFGLIGLLALIFLAELLFAIGSPVSGFEPNIKTLIAFGGLQYLLTVDQGQWYRIFSGPLLHANLSHILSNGIALLLAGYALERAAGRLWFAAIFVIGALGGACGSLLVNPHNLVTVGASGAIMGLFAAILVISVRYTNKPDRLGLQRSAINVLVPSLLPLLTAANGGKVDYAAHASGAAAGAIAAFALLKLWRGTDALPGYRHVAIAIISMGLLGGLAAATAVTVKYRFWSATAQLIPSGYVPMTDSDIQETLEKYPNDPRSHLYEGARLFTNHDLAGAEREFRIVLAAPAIMKEILPPFFNSLAQAMLASVLSDEHRPDEARQAAGIVCQDHSSVFFDRLNAAGLCTSPKQ
jgi:rhomboid protease GluP